MLVNRGVESAALTTSSIVRTSATGRFGSRRRTTARTDAATDVGSAALLMTSVIDRMGLTGGL
jgi:hypothetical protein